MHRKGYHHRKEPKRFEGDPGGEVEISYKSDVSIAGKLAMVGDRIRRARAKKVQGELTSNLDVNPKAFV